MGNDDGDWKKGENLASDGVVGADLGVAEGEKLEINDGGELMSIIEEFYQMIHDKIWAVRAESFVVQCQMNFACLECGDRSPREQRDDEEEEAGNTKERRGIHLGNEPPPLPIIISFYPLCICPTLQMPSKFDKIYDTTLLAATE